MTYLKSLFFNFLVVFFANHVLPGIDVPHPTKLPHIGGDLVFALGLGFLNSLIYPILKIIDAKLGWFHIAVVALVISFVSYAIAKFAPALGITVSSIEGYVVVAVVVAVGAFLTNFLEMRKCCKTAPKIEPPKNLSQ